MKTLDELLKRLRVRFDDGTDPHLWGVYIDMIKSAAAREREAVTDRNHPGNAAAMREALDAALMFLGNLEIEPYSPLDEDASELRQTIMDALSAPPRQCDVGAPEEQTERYNKFCYDHRSYEKCCGGCTLNGEPCCELAWAQTPYEKKGAGE